MLHRDPTRIELSENDMKEVSDAIEKMVKSKQPSPTKKADGEPGPSSAAVPKSKVALMHERVGFTGTGRP